MSKTEKTELQNLERSLFDPDAMIRRAWGYPELIDSLQDVTMYVEDGHLTTELPMPQFRKEDIKVIANGSGIDVHAARQSQTENTEKRHYILQQRSASYWQHISLPDYAITDDIKAEFWDGTLYLTMPVNENYAGRAIEVQ